MPDTSERLVLRTLSLPTRLVIAAFLISVGIGYFSALVQLHFQHATSGNLLPGPEETLDAYYGRPGMSQLERVLTADESKPFNGGGTMRPVFTSKSAGWRQKMRELKNDKPAIQKLREERDGERLALIAWIQKGADKAAYENDSCPLPEPLAAHPITSDYLVTENDRPVTPRRVKIQSILNDRCVRCHAPGKSIVGQFPLDSYENVYLYTEREISSGMSLTKLAQTTHVHLLGFSMLFGLTGLIFSLTSYSRFIRGFFGPFTLVAQVVDIACWWLSRYEAVYTQIMLVTGGLVALGLLIQIVGSLFNLFGKTGKTVLFLLILTAGVGAIAFKARVIEPYLERERIWPEIRDINKKVEAPRQNLPGANSQRAELQGGGQER
jgi:hypothetical protein